MELHHLPLLIPILFLIVWLEYRHNKEHHPTSYKFESTVLNICCGIIERVVDLYIYIGLYFSYRFLQHHFGIFDLNNYALWQWIVCFVLVDFLVYWYHRGGHEINFLWASHVTHHQCDEYNFTVAFRNHILPNIFRGVWLGILPIIGFSAEMIIICLTVSGLWQFLLHTTAIGKLGYLEYIISTPSSHRVHHGSNEQYLDKNYGGFFIVWDKLFGTFAKEIEPVKYGITNGFNSINPIEAYTHVWKDLIRMSKGTSFKTKLKIWLGTPSNFYQEYKGRLPLQTKIENPKPSAPMIYYVTVQLVVTTGLSIGVMVYEDFLSHFQLLLAATSLVLSAISVCVMMGGKKRNFEIEKTRIFVLGMVLILSLPINLTYFVIALVMISGIFLSLEYVEEDWKKRRITF